MSSFFTILITLVRHGQTEYNLKHFTQGQSNIPLNEEGKNQSILAGISLRNDSFDLVYSSDLSRAFETATKIVEQNDLLTEPYNIIPEVILRETSHGVFENRPSEELKDAARAAGFVEPNLKKYKPQNGENQDDVSLRAKKFLEKLLTEQCVKQKGEKSILVVSHGLFLRELLRIFLEEEQGEKSVKDDWKSMLMASTGPNTGISKFNLKINSNCDLVSTECISFLSDDHLNKCIA